MPKRMTKPEWRRFLRERRVGVLATLDAEGRPVLTPIWFIYRAGRILMRTGKDSVKAQNIGRDPRVSLCVQDERPPYRSVTVYGEATIEPADADLGAVMAKRYLGSVAGAAYHRISRESIEESAEITLAVTPQRVATQDYTAEMPVTGRLWLLAKRILPPAL